MSDDWTAKVVRDKLDARRILYNPGNQISQPPIRDNFTFEIAKLAQKTNEELGDILAYTAAWTSYLAAQLAEVEPDFKLTMATTTAARNKKMYEIEKPYNAGSGKKRLVESMHGETLDDENVRVGTQQMIELEALTSQAQRYFDAYKILYDAASREITRRGLLLERRQAT